MSTLALPDVALGIARLKTSPIRHSRYRCASRGPPRLAAPIPSRVAAVEAGPRQVNAPFQFQEIRHT